MPAFLFPTAYPFRACPPAPRRRSWLAALLASTLLAGAVHAQPAPVAPEGRPLPATGESGAALGLTLAAADALLVERNRTLMAAQAARRAARADVARVDVSPNPYLQGQIANTQAGRYPYGASDRVVRLEQLVERGGKRALRVDLADALAQAAGFDEGEALRQQRALLGAAHADLAAAQQLAVIAADNLAGYRRLVDAAARRLAAGDLARADLLRLEVEALRAANEQQAAQATIAQARVALAAVIGMEERAARLLAIDGLSGATDIDAVLAREAGRLQGSLASLIEARADLRGAARRIAAAEKSLALATSLRARDVTLAMQIERAPGFGGTVVGVAVGVPLLINNDYSGEIARARADIDAARTQRDRLAAAAYAEADAAWERLAASAERARRLLRESVGRAQEVVVMVEKGFAEGAGSLNDLFDTRRQLAAVRADAVQAQAEFGKALAAWRAATEAADDAGGVSPPRRSGA
jgi:cobalt-zinc-cadmium efflux system outer membrane protein